LRETGRQWFAVSWFGVVVPGLIVRVYARPVQAAFVKKGLSGVAWFWRQAGLFRF